jgi:hypothetical protein
MMSVLHKRMLVVAPVSTRPCALPTSVRIWRCAFLNFQTYHFPTARELVLEQEYCRRVGAVCVSNQ